MYIITEESSQGKFIRGGAEYVDDIILILKKYYATDFLVATMKHALQKLDVGNSLALHIKHKDSTSILRVHRLPTKQEYPHHKIELTSFFSICQM